MRLCQAAGKSQPRAGGDLDPHKPPVLHGWMTPSRGGRADKLPDSRSDHMLPTSCFSSASKRVPIRQIVVGMSLFLYPCL